MLGSPWPMDGMSYFTHGVSYFTHGVSCSHPQTALITKVTSVSPTPQGWERSWEKVLAHLQ